MSKTIIYMAISTDGYIAGDNNDVDWVSGDSWNSYQRFVRSCDVVIVGKTTYTLMQPDEFVGGVRYLVATHDTDYDSGEYETITVTSRDDMPDVDTIGIIGGGEFNGSLAALGVIDEIILDIEPVILGSGKQLLGGHTPTIHLELIASQQFSESTIQNRYKVISPS
ncbi:dihydrofolate reductase family protein [Candidatus Saccharibacteria bacterium]|nr:dihydrofolate reductase family protein [Candidatus Saccharibacteria bacterium]